MVIQLNGEDRTVASGASVADLVDSPGLAERRIAVEYNGDVLARDRWPETTLQPGDRIEVVHFVGGG